MITLGQELRAMISDNLVLLLITIIAFTGVFLFWSQRGLPEYLAEQRWNVQSELVKRYHLIPTDWRNEIMRDYGFTDDDVNPSKVLKMFMEGSSQ